MQVFKKKHVEKESERERERC